MTHSYILDGTNILREAWGENVLIPLYDNQEQVCGIEYNGSAYFFLKNLQGDVIAITDHNGDTVARYSYDAWGVCTILSDTSETDIASINPYRYRCYYFDPETALYYLQSRYYDPSTGRFINADKTPQVAFSITDCASNNIYTYCLNTPINACDLAGTYTITVQYLSAITASVSGTYLGVAVAKHFGFTGWKRNLCVVAGAALMGIVGALVPLGNLYSAIKSILYTAGYTFLKMKKYNIAAMTYDHGMWGMGNSLSSKQKNKIIEKIKKSSEYQKAKSNLLARIRKGETKPSQQIEFKTTKDLYYAIQHMSINMVYDSYRKKYTVNMSDTYDFTEWRRAVSKAGVSLSNAANNLGYVMQKCGMMIPYKINLSFQVSV